MNRLVMTDLSKKSKRKNSCPMRCDVCVGQKSPWFASFALPHALMKAYPHHGGHAMMGQCVDSREG
jgi:hypothetical protein